MFGLSRDEIDNNTYYTLWQRVGGHWVIERSFMGHYILSTYMDDVEKSWGTSRPFGVFEQGVDPNMRSNPRELSWTEKAVDPGWPRTWMSDDGQWAIEDRGGSFLLWSTEGMPVQHDYWRKKGDYGSFDTAKIRAQEYTNEFARSVSKLYRNPHGSFAGAGGYRETPARRTGLTAKGERMVRDIEADSSYGMDAPGIAYATVYARAKDRPGTGLVTQEWAREHGYPRPNPDVDQVAVRELALFIENDADIYRQHTMPVFRNLSRKWKKGSFDRALAPKAFSYVVEAGAKKYVREFGGGVWHRVFPKPVRDEVARMMTDEFIQEAELGNLYED